MLPKWGFLTNHAQALLLIARNSDTRLRDIAAALDITDRTAYSIIADLTEAGYLVKERDGRRNRYHVQGHLPLPTVGQGEPTIGELLGVLSDAERRSSPPS